MRLTRSCAALAVVAVATASSGPKAEAQAARRAPSRMLCRAYPTEKAATDETAAEAQATEEAHHGGTTLVALDVESCSMVPFPAFLPSAMISTYVGLRIGGAWQSAKFYPFATLPDAYDSVVGAGAIEFSRKLIDSFALVGKVSGALQTGSNPATLLGNGAAVGGGVDIGFAIARSVAGPGQLALTAMAHQRNGSSLLVERAITALPQDPMNLRAIDAAKLIVGAAGKIAVPYREAGFRIDAAWALAPMGPLTVQGSVGVERTHRYYRTDDRFATGDVARWVLPRLGVAAGLDLQPKVPVAIVLEYQLSPTRYQWMPPHEPDPLIRMDTQRERVVEHTAGLGFHFASMDHQDLDAALTLYANGNALPEGVVDVGTDLSVPRVLEIGVQAMARYVW